MKKQKLIFVVLFTIFGFLALQIPVNAVIGSNVSFTLFDLLAPTAGAFLSVPLGVVSVFLMALIDFFVKDSAFEAGPIIRLLPTLFAVYYFGRKDKSNFLVPIIAMVLFWAHPTGRQVWYFALFWLIPLVGYITKDRLFLRSLGSTFSAHAVGSAVWVWVVPMPAGVWISLIPVVIVERLLFASGISLSYLVLTNLLTTLEKRNILPSRLLNLEKRYLFSRGAS
jgi:hypothetical protein